jgi:uncharacterized protein DUF3874
VPAGPNARRFAVFDVSERYASNGDLPEKERKAYFDALFRERDHGGLKAMLYDLLQRDLTGFHPRQVPKTAALNDLKQQSMSDLETFYYQALPEELAWQEGKASLGASEILFKLQKYSKRLEDLTTQKLGRFLSKQPGAARKHTEHGNKWELERNAICVTLGPVR